MFSGTKGEILFDIEPSEGAEIIADGTRYPVSKLPIELSKKTTEVVVTHPEYEESYVIPIDRSFNGGFITS